MTEICIVPICGTARGNDQSRTVYLTMDNKHRGAESPEFTGDLHKRYVNVIMESICQRGKPLSDVIRSERFSVVTPNISTNQRPAFRVKVGSRSNGG